MEKCTPSASLDSLGLGEWRGDDYAVPEPMLGSLAAALGDFTASFAVRVEVPAQRTASRIEATAS